MRADGRSQRRFEPGARAINFRDRGDHIRKEPFALIFTSLGNAKKNGARFVRRERFGVADQAIETTGHPHRKIKQSGERFGPLPI